MRYLGSLIGCLILAWSPGSLLAGDPPNVLMIAIDDLNDWVGCLGGHPQVQTPNIDRMAERGILFSTAHCQAPLCGPSRASLLSGLYPHTTGIYQQPTKNPGLKSDHHSIAGRLLPEYFRDHGYRTLAVGKITHGYDHQLAFEEYGGGMGGSGPKPGGPRERFHYSPDWSLPFSGTQTDWAAFPESDELMPDHKSVSWAIEALARSTDEDPFFLAVGLVRPHVPFYVPQTWFDLYDEQELALPEIPADDLDDIPEIGRQIHAMPRYPSLDFLQKDNNAQLRRCVHAYLACVSFVDHQVGRLLNALEQSQHADNTLIVLFSDHGYHLGEKHRVSKHGLWEEATRVPLVIVPPANHDASHFAAGATCERPVGLIDLYPTLVDLCGLPANPSNQGDSLVPLLADPDSQWRSSVLTTYARECHALRTQTHRYIRYRDGSEELYDHRTDANEWDNLAATEEGQKICKRMAEELPDSNAGYHYTTSLAPVNGWFSEELQQNGPSSDMDDPERQALFDGKSLENWRALGGGPVSEGWQIEDGVIHLYSSKKKRAGHIISAGSYRNFELSFQWKITKGGNGGIKYMVRRYGNKTLGCEYQVLDDFNYRNISPTSDKSAGALYDLCAPSEAKQLLPHDQYNDARIVVQDGRIQHWLNGTQIVDVTVGSEVWDEMYENSKYRNAPGFARAGVGQIMLTDHGGEAWYRNLKLAPLPKKRK